MQFSSSAVVSCPVSSPVVPLVLEVLAVVAVLLYSAKSALIGELREGRMYVSSWSSGP